MSAIAKGSNQLTNQKPGFGIKRKGDMITEIGGNRAKVRRVVSEKQ